MNNANLQAKKKIKLEQRKLDFERKKHHQDVLKFAREEAKKEKKYDGDAFIVLKSINKIYPNHVQAVYDFSLEIKPNEFIVFVGPSGCGKSTTLRMIAGLEEITSGDLYINKEYSNELPPKDRGVTMVFQSYALYPHLTVYENMAFALRIQHFPKQEIDKRIHDAAKILQLEEYLNRKPSALSGGQCQRVALGRAIVTDANIFLMDEPLSNLDAKLRVQMRSEIVKLHNAVNATTIYVTHDQTEAMTMASRIVVMNKGIIQQIGTPDEIFNHPANLFVATFIGSPAMNLFNTILNKNIVTLSDGTTLNLGSDYEKIVNDFYRNEIQITETEINKWKEEFLSRFKSSHKYINAMKSNPLDRIKVLSLVEQFEDDSIITVVENETDEMIKNRIDEYLKEQLYKLEINDNPMIADIENRLSKLKEALTTENKTLIIGVRPEHVLVQDKGIMNLKVNLVELLGSEYYLHLDFADGEILAKVDNDKKISVSDVLNISFKNSEIHIFDPITRKNIQQAD